jgi:hypothetical protein
MGRIHSYIEIIDIMPGNHFMLKIQTPHVSFMTYNSLQCEVQRKFHKNFHMYWFLRISNSMDDAVHFHGDRSDDTELPGQIPINPISK